MELKVCQATYRTSKGGTSSTHLSGSLLLLLPRPPAGRGQAQLPHTVLPASCCAGSRGCQSLNALPACWRTVVALCTQPAATTHQKVAHRNHTRRMGSQGALGVGRSSIACH